MSYLRQLLDIDRDAQQATTDLDACFRWVIKQGSTPRTADLFHAQLCSLDDLRETIYEGCRRQDLIGTMIVYRAFIERYLRFFYLFIRQAKEPSDALTQRYIDAQAMQELALCHWDDYLLTADSQACTFSLALIWEPLTAGHVRLARYSLAEAESLLAEFSWEAMQSTLETSKVRRERSTISSLIYDHARMLCYVQGSLLLETFQYYLQRDERIQDELHRACQAVLTLTLEAKILCCHFYEDQHEAFSAVEKRLQDLAWRVEDIP